MNSKDLLGKWHVRRVVSDFKGKTKSIMIGSALFSPSSTSSLLYYERMQHHCLSRQITYWASKEYRYFFTQRVVAIYFHKEQGERLFLLFPIEGQEQEASTLCGEDRYVLRWEWRGKGHFYQHYRVFGLSKAYLITSVFSR